jgi:hypothetical protein
MWNHRITLLSLLVSACFASPLHAGKVKVWRHNTPAAHDKARFEQTVVTSEGVVRLGRQLKPLAELPVSHVWSVIEDRDGKLLVATGDGGRVYQVAADGAVSVAFDTGDSQVLSLAQLADGTTFAGTGPNGKLIRIAPNGDKQTIHECPDSYIWSLAVDPSATTVYAGTGPKGVILSAKSTGDVSPFYTTRQPHVLCLAVGANGLVYAGTDRDGLIYRIDANGKGFVMHHAPQSDVRGLLVTDNRVYAGTAMPHRRDVGSRGLVDRLANSGVPGVLASNSRSASKVNSGDAPGTKESNSPLKDEKKTQPAPTIAPPHPGENSVYVLGADGGCREIFREKALILSLAARPGKLLIGTGTDGQLFEVDEGAHERAELARLNHGDIHCLYERRDGAIVIGAGDPGKLYLLTDGFASNGALISDVLDARLPSEWGALRWQADLPKGASLTVSVRSGNGPTPDDTWSDWSAEAHEPSTSTIAAPPARFLQYRVRMKSDSPEATPGLRSISLRYRTVNRPPEVESIDVPDFDVQTAELPKKVKLKWAATDPNEDELVYDVFAKKDGWSDWVLLQEDVDKRELEWDTTTTPSGVYRIKILASDRRENAPDRAGTGERISAEFPVAHEPPAVSLRCLETTGDSATFEADASDGMVRLAAATYSIDGKHWVPVFPVDGLFDRAEAKFRFTARDLKAGSHVIVLRVRDAAGNTGTADVVFRLSK